MPTRRQIDNAEAGGEPLTPEQKLCRIVLPVNQVSVSTGHSPLGSAAGLGKGRCVELLLADDRVDVTLPCANGQTPLLSACIHLMTSMDQVGAGGGNDPARCLVVMLKSRRLPKHNVEETIQRMGNYMPTRRQIDAAAAGGEPLNDEQKACRIVSPCIIVLPVQSYAASSSPCGPPRPLGAGSRVQA